MRLSLRLRTTWQSALKRLKAQKKAFETLKWRMENHSAGPLILHDTKLCDGRYFKNNLNEPNITEHIAFMGYKIQYFPPANEVSYAPNNKAFNKFWERVQGIGYSGNVPVWHHKMSSTLLEALAFKHLEKWSNSFPLWEINKDLFKLFYMADFCEKDDPSIDLPYFQRTHDAYNHFFFNLTEQMTDFRMKHLVPKAA